MEKHFLIAKVLNKKKEKIFWESYQVDLGEKGKEEITKMLNDSLKDLVVFVPAGCDIEMKIVTDPAENVDVTV